MTATDRRVIESFFQQGHEFVLRRGNVALVYNLKSKSFALHEVAKAGLSFHETNCRYLDGAACWIKDTRLLKYPKLSPIARRSGLWSGVRDDIIRSYLQGAFAAISEVYPEIFRPE